MFGFLLAQGVLFFSALFMIGLVIGIATATQKEKSIEVKPEADKILRISLTGSIVERQKIEQMLFNEDFPLLGEELPIGLYELEKTLKLAAKDKTIKGLYLTFGPLDAGWAALNSVRDAIIRFQKTGKFVYAYSNYFSEASYYIASVADAIFMYPQGDFELNGFATVMGFVKGSLEKLEVQVQVFRAGSYKSAIEPFVRENMSDENREQLLALNRDFWWVFSRAISASRKISEKEIDRMANQLLVTNAEEAQKYKLVDQLKYEDEVLEFLKGIVPPNKKDRLPFISMNRYLVQSSKKAIKAEEIFSLSQSTDLVDSPTVAVVFAEGEIHRGHSDEGSIGSRSFVEMLRKVRKDDDIKAVVLRVNSPGGDALASDEIWREVVLLNKVKPVIASFANVAASGGYYLAAGAKKILVQPLTVTGSIGVFGLSLVTKDMFKNKLGITFDEVKTHASADMMQSHRKMTDSEVYVVEKEVDRVYDRFLSVVQKGRSIPEDKLRSIAGGRVWSGSAATKLKLSDQVGGLSQAIDLAYKEAGGTEEDFDVETFPKQTIPFGRLFQVMSARVKQGLGFGSQDFEVIQKTKKWLEPEKNHKILTVMPFELKTL